MQENIKKEYEDDQRNRKNRKTLLFFFEIKCILFKTKANMRI